MLPTADEIESLLAIRPLPWFAVSIADKVTGREFTIRMNERDPSSCEARAWTMGFAVGRIVPSAPLQPDPAMEHARAEIRREVAALFQPPDRRTLQDIYGPDVESRLRNTIQELSPEGLLGLTPAEFAEGICKESDKPWEESVAERWHFIQTTARMRLRGRVFETWVRATNRECTTEDLLAATWLDAHPIDRHFLLDKLGEALLHEDRLRAEAACWQWFAEFNSFKPHLCRNPNQPVSYENMVNFATPDILAIIMEESGFDDRAEFVYDYVAQLADSP